MSVFCEVRKSLANSDCSRICILFFLCAAFFLSCSRIKQFELGFTPIGSPITLSISGNGIPNISFGKKIFTPIGYWDLSYNAYNDAIHRTYVEIVNRHEKKKYTFELLDVDEKISWETNKWCKVEITNQSYSTVVTVDSDEISNLLHEKKGAGYKPHFPSQPFAYFYLIKKINRSVNWEINSVGDFFADIFFAIIWLLAAYLDVIIILISFVVRFLWWILLLIGYLLGII